MLCINAIKTKTLFFNKTQQKQHVREQRTSLIKTPYKTQSISSKQAIQLASPKSIIQQNSRNILKIRFGSWSVDQEARKWKQKHEGMSAQNIYLLSIGPRKNKAYIHRRKVEMIDDVNLSLMSFYVKPNQNQTSLCTPKLLAICFAIQIYRTMEILFVSKVN